MDFLGELKSRVMVGSGAIGTALEKEGFVLGGNAAVWQLEHPDIFRSLRQRWLDAGVDLVPGGGGSANRLRLEHYGFAEEAPRINREQIKMARQICPPGRYVCGLLGNLGKLMQPLGKVSYEEAYESYAEQAVAMADAGADLVWIETMTEVPAMEACIKAVKDNTSLPVIATMTFDPNPRGFRTMMGVGPQEAAEKLDCIGADVIGANCGKVSPAEMSEVLRQMAQVTAKPLAAKPNAGTPQVVDGQIVYPVKPEEMAACVPGWIAAGARVVTGCCGSSLEHIAKIAEVVHSSFR